MKSVLFLDASNTNSMYLNGGTRVDEWMDSNKSGKSVATAAALSTSYNPTYNPALFGGKGGVTFNNKFLESPAAFSEMNWKKGFTILLAGTVRSGFHAASDAAGYILAGMGWGRCMGLGTAAQNKNALPDVPCVFGVRWSGTEFQFVLNGKLFPVTRGSPSFGTAAFGKLQIGGLINSAGAMDMDLAGLKLFDQELDYDTLQKECDALSCLYGFAPVAEPKFNIVADGTSLAIGGISASKTTMWDGVKAVTGTHPQDLINVAVDGLETPSMTVQAPAKVDVLLNLGVPSKRRICIAWEISNDLANSAQTSAGAYANIKAYCQARKAAGWKVIVGTCLPRTAAGINANFESCRLAVNALIIANAVSEGWADAVADFGGDATIGATGASDNTSYYLSDKASLNSAGHLIAAGYVTSALNAIL